MNSDTTLPEGPAGSGTGSTPVYCGDPHGTAGHEPNHLLRKPVLLDGGLLFLEMARVFPHSRPESHYGCTEIGVRNSGAFRELHSDHGTNFESKLVLEVCWLFGIYKTRTTLYHPRSNEFIERSFRKLGRCLKAACRETRQEWNELVPLILMSYRVTPQASTGPGSPLI